MTASVPPTRQPPDCKPTGPCSRCGKPDVAKFGDEFICDDCYTACGSCCAEWFEDREP